MSTLHCCVHFHALNLLACIEGFVQHMVSLVLSLMPSVI